MQPRAVEGRAAAPARRRPWASGTSSSVASSGMSARSAACRRCPARPRRAPAGPATPARSRRSAWSAASSSARSAAACTSSVGDAVEQVGGEPFEQPLRGPGRWSRARRCARRRWRPTARRCRRRPAPRSRASASAASPLRDRGRGHLAPRDPRADPVRREQRVDGPAAARLAATELVGALDGRGGRRPRVGAAASAGQGEEAAQRQLDGVADGLAHGAAERVGVAGDLVDDRGDRAVGDVGQLAAHLGDRLGGEEDAVTSGTSWRFVRSSGPELSPANKCDVTVHAARIMSLSHWIGHPGRHGLALRSPDPSWRAACAPRSAAPRRRGRRHPAGARPTSSTSSTRCARGAELRGRIVSVHPETEDAATLVIKPGADWAGHVPGQYVRVGIDVDGVRLWRAYSLTHGPRPRRLHLDHRQGDPGRHGQPTTSCTAPGPARWSTSSRPQGEFVLPDADAGKLLFVTAGSGITPVIGMLRNLFSGADGRAPAQRSATTTSSCVHVAPSRARLAIFRDDLRALARRRRPSASSSGTTTSTACSTSTDLDELVPDLAERTTYACGPAGLLDALEAHHADARPRAAHRAVPRHAHRSRPARAAPSSSPQRHQRRGRRRHRRSSTPPRTPAS